MNTNNCDMCGCTKTDAVHHCYRKSISWTAIIVGAFVGLGLSFLLNLFSVATSLSIITTTKEGAVNLAIGGFIGVLIGTIAAMFTAGFTAGYLGRGYCIKRNLGALYGFTTWCVALIFAMAFSSHLGRYVTEYSHFITNPTVVTMPHRMSEMPVIQAAAPNSVVTVESQPTTHELGIGAFLIFALFAVGALSSCFGGHFGMCGCCCPSGCNCSSCCKKTQVKEVK
ncbi:MAG: hypothetical protein P4M14_11875 [Gammaproteobacteria bacterium]|nr:hypothetical protein [Gammaproteobacteria bacterium]